MQILFVSLAVPFPPTNGHCRRNWALLQALAEEGHELTLVSFEEPLEMGRNGSSLRQVCRHVELIPLPAAARSDGGALWGRLRALTSPLPYGAWRFRCKAMSAAVQAWLARAKFDVVICDDTYNVKNLPEAVSVPVLLNKHDITHVIVRRYLTYETNPAKLAYGWLEYCKLRRWEALACSSLNGVLACSAGDRDLLQALSPGADIQVVPNVVNVADYAPVAEDDGKTVLYVGAMDWYPNQDAVEFFASEIFPRLRKIDPKVQFVVVGRNPSEKLRRRFAAVKGIRFTGAVPDVRPEIAKAAICVVPLRIGSGTRLKILEAGAMGKAIVSTRLGAEGLEFVDGEEILLADAPQDFAQVVADLLDDAPRRRVMGLAARRRVQEQYSLPVLRTTLRQSLALLAEKARAVNAR